MSRKSDLPCEKHHARARYPVNGQGTTATRGYPDSWLLASLKCVNGSEDCSRILAEFSEVTQCEEALNASILLPHGVVIYRGIEQLNRQLYCLWWQKCGVAKLTDENTCLIWRCLFVNYVQFRALPARTCREAIWNFNNDWMIQWPHGLSSVYSQVGQVFRLRGYMVLSATTPGDLKKHWGYASLTPWKVDDW